MAKSAAWWKVYYTAERARLAEQGALDALFDRAPLVALAGAGALVFPHTRLEVSGHLVAAVAQAVVAAGVERVLALGVLHGARERDATLLAQARASDPSAVAALRRVHRDDGAGHASEEFSLDGFLALLDRAAARAGRRVPTVVARYPFLVGDDPSSLPGIDELHALVADGCALVATTDPIHHGVGYGTPRDACRELDDARTHDWARHAIREQLDALERRDWPGLQRAALVHRSDFRDVGPVLATLNADRGTNRYAIDALCLVDYTAALEAAAPTWVAGALVTAR